MYNYRQSFFSNTNLQFASYWQLDIIFPMQPKTGKGELSIPSIWNQSSVLAVVG